MTSPALFRRPQALWLLGALLLAVLVVTVFAYVARAAGPIIRGDDWYYTVTFVRDYLDGHLGFLDFFLKRGPGENAQPLNRLVLLGLTQWFDMDFWYQGLFGAVLAVGCVALLGWFTWRAPAPAGRPAWVMPLLLVMLGAIVLSLSAAGDFSWPLVTALVYTGTLGISLYFYWAFQFSTQGAWLKLAVLTFLTLVLLDTFATLAVLAAILLMLARLPGDPHKRPLLISAVATAVALVLYQHLFAWLTGTVNSPLQASNLAIAVHYALSHLDEAWKVLVAPFGAALYEPVSSHHTWEILIPLAVIMWGCNVWFWWQFSQRRDDRMAFLAAGLMLYSYATVGGMLVDRIPDHGFDFLLQPRYVGFYQLQAVAVVLMWGRIPVQKIRPVGYAGLAAVACLFLLSLDAYAAQQAWYMLRFLPKYENAVVAQINALARDPAHPPQGCLADITPCRWDEVPRRQVLQIMESHQLNVFSAKMRERHGYTWQELPPTAP